MEQVIALLDSFLERVTSRFASVLSRWHLALIRIPQATDDEDTVRRGARVCPGARSLPLVGV
jgi:hypothetical protein